jgi:hypothetical protein
MKSATLERERMAEHNREMEKSLYKEAWKGAKPQPPHLPNEARPEICGDMNSATTSAFLPSYRKLYHPMPFR